jgi:hypothetical protein
MKPRRNEEAQAHVGLSSHKKNTLDLCLEDALYKCWVAMTILIGLIVVFVVCQGRYKVIKSVIHDGWIRMRL